jgi:hypothetical protein
MAAMQSIGISQHLGSISPRADNPTFKKKNLLKLPKTRTNF